MLKLMKFSTLTLSYYTHRIIFYYILISVTKIDVTNMIPLARFSLKRNSINITTNILIICVILHMCLYIAATGNRTVLLIHVRTRTHACMYIHTYTHLIHTHTPHTPIHPTQIPCTFHTSSKHLTHILHTHTRITHIIIKDQSTYIVIEKGQKKRDLFSLTIAPHRGKRIFLLGRRRYLSQ